MPPAAANVVAAPPIAVNVTAIPPEEKSVAVPANHPLVVNTAFLGYVDAPAVGGVQRKQLTNGQMLRAFGRRCKLAQALAQAPAIPPDILQLALSTQGWTKVLQELLASGILNATFGSLDELEKAIDGLTITNPGNLVLVGADLDLGEDTAAVAGTVGQAAVPAQGRRGQRGFVAAQQAVAAVPGRPALDDALTFLSAAYAPVTYLEVDGVAPWANVVYLCGALGPCLTQTARNGMGSARLTASSLAMGINKAFGVGTRDYPSLAGELPNFLSSLRTRMPTAMRCVGADLNELRLEFRDTILYGLSREDRVRVEIQRIRRLGAR